MRSASPYTGDVRCQTHGEGAKSKPLPARRRRKLLLTCRNTNSRQPPADRKFPSHKPNRTRPNNADKVGDSAADNSADKVAANNAVKAEDSAVDDKAVVAKVVVTNRAPNPRRSRTKLGLAFSNTMLAPALQPPWRKRASLSAASRSRAATS